jgi:hypothetical protein
MALSMIIGFITYSLATYYFLAFLQYFGFIRFTSAEITLLETLLPYYYLFKK